MLKPDSLRAWLTDAIPEIKAEPSRLQIHIERGSVRSLGAPINGLAWEYRYALSAIALDLTTHPDAVFAALIGWVSIYQTELLQSFDKNRQGIAFDVEVLDAKKIDLDIRLELTEVVRAIPRPGGGHTIIHDPEPPQAGMDQWPDGPAEPPPIRSIWIGDELVAELPDG